MDNINQALHHLRRRDPVLRTIIRQVGTFRLRPPTNHFRVLVASIISQQISTKAAESIHRRLAALAAPSPLRPETLRRLTCEQLRSAGLSQAKATYLQDLAEKVDTGVVNLRRLHRLDDETVIEELTQVKGIGRWTAEMFLIFSLRRPDVLPVDDLGLRAAIQRCDRLPELPTKAQVRERGLIWRPYCTVATWYLWQSLRLARASDRSNNR